ncbi:MAG: ribonuclease HI [Nitrospinota bacterium]|nr:ribonuclease HI [Nitrospinota bacterium]
MEKVQIFTDGCCKGNPGPGGYGCIIKYKGKTQELTGAEQQTTNNVMEMKAVIAALNELKEPCEVKLTTDSQYVVKGMTEWIHQWIKKNWVNASRQPVKNQSLWEELLRLDKRHRISWRWVKGHAGHPENERCDELANQALGSL